MRHRHRPPPTPISRPVQALHPGPNSAAAGQAASGAGPGIREAALAYGLDLSSFQDDSAAWAYMVQAAQRGTERNYYAELGQQIAPHYQQIQSFLQQQQPPKEAEKPPPWKHPEYDQRWMSLVERDPATGTYRPKPGINPQWADKVQPYHDSIDGWATGIVQDPESSLGPLIRQVAGQLLEERFGAQAVQQEAQRSTSRTRAGSTRPTPRPPSVRCRRPGRPRRPWGPATTAICRPSAGRRQ